MKIGEETTVYVRALSNGEWFGGWAPVRARLEWLREAGAFMQSEDDGPPSLRYGGQVGLFTLTEEDLDEDDEYEFYEVGSLLLGKKEDGEFRIEAGVVFE